MERSFWDASAFLALVFIEPRSSQAVAARDETNRLHAWDWMAVEAKSALIRRSASVEHHQKMDALLEVVHWHSVPSRLYPQVIECNKEWKLRAAAAGHLFCFQRLFRDMPAIQLVTFDNQMRQAAAQGGLAVWAG